MSDTSSLLTQIAFDIETTGFEITDEVTAIGFMLPLGARIFCQTAGRDDVDDIDVEAAVRSESSKHTVVSLHPTETDLIRAVDGFCCDRLKDEDVVLVAYNGESWSGGFDLPFLRTRLSRIGEPWPFVNVAYTDLLPIVEKQFNTTAADAEQNTLAHAYRALVDGDDSEIDPFVDSSEAVRAFEEGDFTDLCLHNLADICRTAAIGTVAESYCSRSDFTLKSLSPTRGDRL